MRGAKACCGSVFAVRAFSPTKQSAVRSLALLLCAAWRLPLNCEQLDLRWRLRIAPPCVRLHASAFRFAVRGVSGVLGAGGCRRRCLTCFALPPVGCLRISGDVSRLCLVLPPRWKCSAPLSLPLMARWVPRLCGCRRRQLAESVGFSASVDCLMSTGRLGSGVDRGQRGTLLIRLSMTGRVPHMCGRRPFVRPRSCRARSC